MKIKIILILAACCLLTLSGCGIIGPLPATYYAELRIGDDNKSQILIESDQWLGLLNPIGHPGNQHYIECSYYVRGDGPVYVVQDEAGNANAVGTITIDREHKSATLDVELMSKSENMLIQRKPNMWDGTYRLALVNHDPFYSYDNRK